MKKTKSAIIARRARTTTLFLTAKNASLFEINFQAINTCTEEPHRGKRMQAPQAKMSKPRSEEASGKDVSMILQ